MENYFEESEKYFEEINHIQEKDAKDYFLQKISVCY